MTSILVNSFLIPLFSGIIMWHLFGRTCHMKSIQSNRWPFMRIMKHWSLFLPTPFCASIRLKWWRCSLKANQSLTRKKTSQSNPLPGNKSIALFDSFNTCIPGIVCPKDFPPTWIKYGLFDRLRYLSFGRLTNAYFSITFLSFLDPDQDEI